MSGIRNFAREDMPAVAGLFQRTFRDPDAAAPQGLAAYFAEAYLDHPWYDPEVAARVHENAAGRITGFIGVFPGRFQYRDRIVRAAIAGTLMVEEREREPLAGAKLLRSVVKGPQDISISETTNLVSQRLWEPLGGRVMPMLSLDWFRVLRPARAGLAMLAERVPAASHFTPLARAADWIGHPWIRRGLGSGQPAAGLVLDPKPTDSDFAAAVMELTLAQPIEVRPAWKQPDLEWLVLQAALKSRHGSLYRAIVRGRNDELVGCWIYHGRAGGMGRVLQLLARPRQVGAVVDHLLHAADKTGLAGLRGRCTPQLMDALLTRRCFFLHRASTVIHTADRGLAEAIETGGAMINGLAGESWTRLVGDEFG